MPRVVWKGAITFGLVHIPVNLYPGSTASALDFDLLDKRDFAPIGYRRVNKRTGKEVGLDDTVKGYEYEDGRYVVMSEEDFKRANVKATQTVDIQAFVDGAEIPAHHFDTPYYLEPGKRGEKGYALLRETLRKTGRVGVANVVLRARQHLAVVMPIDRLLLLNTLRFAGEIRPVSKLRLPGLNLKQLGVSSKEMEMAARLVGDMTERWKPEAFKDTYRSDLLARIRQKVKTHKTHEVTEPAAGEAPRRSAEVIDLMAALRKSLDRKGAKRPQRRAALRGRSAPSRRSPAIDQRRRRA
jgi:DNA end-binding protein Ku